MTYVFFSNNYKVIYVFKFMISSFISLYSFSALFIKIFIFIILLFLFLYYCNVFFNSYGYCKIFNRIAELVIPGKPNKEAKAEIEMHPEIVEAHIRKCLIYLELYKSFCAFYS